MNILVTGGAGFIGSHFIRYMLNKYGNYKIVNYDALTYAGNLESLHDVLANERYAFVKGDILNAQLVDYVVKTYAIDVIVNFAAESHVDRSISDPAAFVKTNVLGTQVLLDVARANSIEKYVQISTDEVYGSLGETGYFTEETPLAPNSPYSASKASADLLVRAYYETYGLNVNITRCSNNYGPYQFPVVKDERGSLVVVESLRHVPFEIKRVYYIYDVSEGKIRGAHAHRQLQQVLICLAGACKVCLDDGREKKTFVLDSPQQGLFVGKMIWREMSEFTSNCVLLVLADDYYKEEDYIRDYATFISEVQSDV